MPSQMIAQLLHIMDTIPIGVMILDRDMAVVSWNKLLADWTGIPSAQVVGTSIVDRYPHLGTVRYAGRILPIFDAGPPVVFSPQLHPHFIPSVRIDGQQRILQTTVTPTTLNGCIYAVVSIQDVTDLMLTAQESRQLYRMALKEIEYRKRVEDELQVSSERVRSIVDTVMEAIIVINTDLVIEEFNHAAEQIFGYAAEEVIGKSILLLMPEPYHSEHGGYMNRYLQTGVPHIMGKGKEATGLRKDGTLFPVQLGVNEMQLGNKRLFTGIISDITERKQAEFVLEEANRRYKSLSFTDGLTGVANRRRFDEVLDREYSRHTRSGGELALILLDIDYFKSYNDTYGHVQGDDCLRTVSQAISSCITRPADLVARYGGEEFACILPETDLRGAVTIAEKIRQTIVDCAIPHDSSKAAAHVTASLGVVVVTCTLDQTCEDILNQVDELLYLAKSRGRNRVEYL